MLPTFRCRKNCSLVLSLIQFVCSQKFIREISQSLCRFVDLLAVFLFFFRGRSLTNSLWVIGKFSLPNFEFLFKFNEYFSFNQHPASRHFMTYLFSLFFYSVAPVCYLNFSTLYQQPRFGHFSWHTHTRTHAYAEIQTDTLCSMCICILGKKKESTTHFNSSSSYCWCWCCVSSPTTTHTLIKIGNART